MKPQTRPNYIQIGDKEVYFKAEFGNEDHIYILKILERIRKTKALYLRKLKEGKESKALKTQLEDLRKRAISLIEFSNKKDEENQKQNESSQESKESREEKSQA